MTGSKRSKPVAVMNERLQGPSEFESSVNREGNSIIQKGFLYGLSGFVRIFVIFDPVPNTTASPSESQHVYLS